MIVLSKFELVLLIVSVLVYYFFLRNVTSDKTDRAVQDIEKGIKRLKSTIGKPYGEPFVIRPNEYEIEQEQKRAEAKKEKGFENIKEFVKKVEK